MSGERALNDLICDDAPDLLEAVEGLLMTTGFIGNTERHYPAITVLDRRRLMWLHRAWQHHIGEPMTDYSEWSR